MTQQMPMERILFWAPRVLGILFALDVFGAGYGFWGTILALFMHLIPVYVLLIALAVAWRYCLPASAYGISSCLGDPICWSPT